MHAEEQPKLIPLPVQPYETALVVHRTVNAEGFLSYRQNEYSVPWLYIGRVLPVRVTEDEVIIYGPKVEEIARHRLFPRTVTGQRSEQKAHRPSEDPRQRHAQLQERFLELGPDARRFLDGLVRSQRYSKDHAHKVLALLAIYARADLSAARPPACGSLRRLLVQRRRTRPGRAGKAQDRSRIAGRAAT